MKLKLLHWIPRIICILAIVFVSLFALDAFDSEHTFLKQLTDFLIHLIPSFVLLGILILAWKKELIGGIILCIIGLGFTPWIFMHNFKMNQSVGASLVTVLLISFPFLVVGILFILSHFAKKKSEKIKS